MNKIKKIFFVLFLGGLAFFVMGKNINAASNIIGVDTNANYDIYFSTGENGRSVLKNLKILRLQDIAGKTFLVVRSADFKLKEADGFIALNGISAILPNQEFRVISSTDARINY